MRTLTTIAATLGVIGAIAVGSAVPAAAWYGYHHRYYHHPTVTTPTITVITTPITPTTIIVTTVITGTTGIRVISPLKRCLRAY